MPRIRAILWDIGGVLLTNAWDHTERAEALAHFGLDPAEFQARHQPLVDSFERGQLTLEEYLDKTVFYSTRPFTRDDFRNFMFSLSKPFTDVIPFAEQLSATGKYLMGTINNESRELNQYRIDAFHLRKIFSFFCSSCFVGLRKPQPEIYRLALEVTQIPAEQCCFIDDRAPNLESPAQLGMKTIQMRTLEQLRADLNALGVTL